MDQRITSCFHAGFKHQEIVECLRQFDGIEISLRSLRRRLKSMKLYRRKHQSNIVDVALFVLGQLEKHGELHGYKLMHLKCIQAGLTVTQETRRA